MSDFFDDFGQQTVVAEASTSRPKKRRGLGRAFVLAGLLAALVALVMVLYPLLGRFTGGGDYEGPGEGEVTVVIPEGATGTHIAGILAEADVVKTERAFINEFNADSRAASIQPGTYTLRTHMSAADALSALLDPASKAEIKVTIPEGFTKQQVFERLANLLGVSVDEVSAAAADAQALGLPSEAAGDIEGWIAPLTYTFEPGTTVNEALSQMVGERVAQMESLGIDRGVWEETLIKASIVEREAINADDYAKVARVIENRLADTDSVNGRLQMDSTVLYGVGKTGGSPTQAELDGDTPYNTYVHAGLTPTPIGNPGTAAIEGALHPAEGDWLYFVTVNLDSGETKFASSLEEHEANIEEYRAWVAENPQ